MQENKITLLLHLADNALILGHRNSEWTGHGPILEQDIAISNIALDLVGQARNFYQYAADLINAENGLEVAGQNASEISDQRGNRGSAESKVTLDATLTTEDSLAYLRDVQDFRNHNIVELPKGDWAVSTLRQLLVSLYQKFYYKSLLTVGDAQLNAILEKSLKEVEYHIKWSGEWVVRLGDGTEESRKRLINALSDLWPYTREFFEPAQFEEGIDLESIEEQWNKQVIRIFEMATLLTEYSDISTEPGFKTTGKNGIHTEHLGYILAEMQYLQRAYPGCEW
jgi:ring-1,2-phenylacetyl-CoA epoxidase subunit PaaC